MNTATLHPIMVHFPVALLSAGFAVDLIGLFRNKEECFSKAGLILMFLGFLGAIAALLTGFIFTGDLEGEAGAAKERHELFAILTMVAVSLTLALRIWLAVKKNENQTMKYLVLGCVLVTASLVLITGYLGGDIIWTYFIGV